KIAGAWVNVSQFRPVDLPEAGARVRVDVDSRGYIKALEVLGASAVPAVSSAKDDRITRLAVLKAAASFPRPAQPDARGRTLRARPRAGRQVARPVRTRMNVTHNS